MKIVEYHCPNCGKTLSFKKNDKYFECTRCQKKYQYDTYMLRHLLFFIIVIVIPAKIMNEIIERLDFIEQKVLVFLLIVIGYILVLYFSGAVRFLEEKFKIVKWHEIKVNQDNGQKY